MELVLFSVIVGGAAVLLVRGTRAAVAIALAAALVGSGSATLVWPPTNVSPDRPSRA